MVRFEIARGAHCNRRRRLLGNGVFLRSALAAALGTPAAAQEELDLSQAETAEASSDQGNAIVVTARRREESLQETPIAISAFSAETLEQRQIVQTQDLERITASLQFKPAGQLSGNSAASVVFIRGVGQLDPTAAVDPGVGVYIDDVYIPTLSSSLLEPIELPESEAHTQQDC